MAHLYRFIATPEGGHSDARYWTLTEDEAFHLVKVLRLKAGDQVEVMDGHGHHGTGTVVECSPKAARVDVTDRHYEHPPTQRLIVALGALKPGAIDEILPPLVELGVDEIKVFHQADTAKARVADKVQDRWERIVVSAVKQCKRAYLPKVHAFDSLEAMVDASLPHGVARFLLSPLAPRSLLEALPEVKDPIVEMVFGGERGLTALEERILTKAGYQPVNFGRFVLRAVTAVVAATAVAAQVRHARA